MSALQVVATDALCAPGPPTPGWVAIEDGVLVDIGHGLPPGDRGDVVHLGDAVLAPGFIDLQCNGLDGIDFATTDDIGFASAAAALARHGTTAFCATLISAPLDSYDAPLTRAAATRGARRPGEAELLGIHLEGPFLGDAPGAHDPSLVRAVDLPWLDGILDRHPQLVRIVTLAPEADPGQRAVRLLIDAGVVVALGHSRASYADTLSAADAGASVVTHLFNGMSPLHHREPGMVGAALDDGRLTPTLIADGVHVHPAVLRLILARKTKVAVVSDSVAPTGAAIRRGGAATLPDGTLAGATTLLDRSVATLVAAGVAIERAIEVVTSVPAGLLGLEDRGRLAIGNRADVVALDPVSFVPRAVGVGGDPVPGIGGPEHRRPKYRRAAQSRGSAGG